MKNLIVAVDFSDQASAVLELARSFARGFQCKAWLIHVSAPDPDFVGYDVGPQSVRDSVAQHVHDDHKKLQEFAADFRTEGIDATALLVQGPTVETLLAEVERLKVDHLLMGSHGQGGIRELLMGSVSKGVLKRCPVPVTLVGPANQIF